jgi:hypothetical protein
MNPCTVGCQQDFGSGFDGSVLCYCGTEPARPHVNCDPWPMQSNVEQTEKEVFIELLLVIAHMQHFASTVIHL